MSAATEIHCVLLERRTLPRDAFVLYCERNGLQFTAGEHILLGLVGDIERREYSLYSAEQDDRLAVLVKRVAGGAVSQRLANIAVGAALAVEGPFGYFTIDAALRSTRQHICIATGSGIAPYRSLVCSYPELRYQIIHGTRYADECYDRHYYAPDQYLHCVSREAGGAFRGRVTDYLRSRALDRTAYYYLCGNCDMIYEAFDILKDGGVPIEQIATEVYF